MQSDKDQLREYLNQLIINHEARLGDLDIRVNTLEVKESLQKKNNESILLKIIQVLIGAILGGAGIKYYDK